MASRRGLAAHRLCLPQLQLQDPGSLWIPEGTSFENAQVEHISRYSNKSLLRSLGRLHPAEPRHGVAAGGRGAKCRSGQLEQEGIYI